VHEGGMSRGMIAKLNEYKVLNEYISIRHELPQIYI
jgi:hypothetical protein